MWRTVNGLAALIDPVAIALTMGGTSREGPFVGVFIDAASEHIPVGPQQLQEWITQRVLARTASPDETQPASVQDFVKFLRDLFELGDPDPVRLLPTLLKIYETYPAANHPPSELGDLSAPGVRADFEHRLGAALGEALQQLETESGFEALALRLLELSGVNADGLTAQFGTDPETAKKAFKRSVAEAFNGRETARFAVGTIFEHFLIQPWNGQDANIDAAAIAASLAETNWFVARFGLSDAKRLGDLVAQLPRAAAAFIDAQDKQRLADAAPPGLLTEAFVRACAEVLGPAGAAPGGRFIPDTAPRTLPVRIGVDHSLDDMDAFSLTYAGVAVLLQRAGDAAPRWAYGNLAELTMADTAPVMGFHPVAPVAVDGQRALFLEYAGVPFASTSFASAEQPDPAWADHVPFYLLDDPAGDQLGGKAKLPALAYGSIYKLAAFAVSRSGALPRSMAEHDWRWKPVDAPAPPTDDLPWAEQHLYSRRTAIGRVSIVEVPEAGRVRFEAATPDVTPLAHDYRRRGHGCDAGEDTVFDLWRHTDGTGAIAISPSAAAQTLQLHDVWTWRGGGILALTMLHDPSVPPDPLAAAHWRVRIAKPFVHGHLSLTIGNEPNRLFTLGLGGAGWAIEGSADIPGAGLPVEGAIWLHAQLIPDDGGCALSFADPTPEVGDPHAAPRRSADSFVLLARKDEAPDKRNRWSDALAQSVSAQIRFPCVSHADLDRWLENPVLRQEAGDVRKIDAFRTDIIALMLSASPPTDLERWLTNLPDPAVDQLLVELTPLDSLHDEPGAIVAAAPATRLRQIIALPRLGDMSAVSGSGTIFERLRGLDQEHSAALDIKPSADGKWHLTVAEVGGRHRIEAMVPPGMVGRLSVRPMVDARYFEAGTAAPVIDPRLRTLAVGQRGNHFVFDGPGLMVEVASFLGLKQPLSAIEQPEWATLAEEMISVRSTGRERRYELAVQDLPVAKADPRWRRLGSIEIQSQRWRFLGHPIRSWFTPKSVAKPATDDPVVKIDPGTSGLADFEAEAFLGRDDDVDSEIVKLAPLPLVSEFVDADSKSRLHDVAWELPSAMIFRHRFILRSRYAGAMRLEADRSVWGMAGTSKGPRAWRRVAILADRSRLQLTRPQLRALLPLTTAAHGTGTPPILAMLEEHPFAYGGLADRVVAEVRTGFGYEVQGGGGEELLEIRDSRKEFGLDPRLTYHPALNEAAQALTLVQEGPVGLTFDGENAPAPAFANTAWLLTPHFLTAQSQAANPDLEEHFLSVSLRRYTDPDWTTDSPDQSAPVKELPANEAWWIDLPGPLTMSAGNSSAMTKIISATNDAKLWTLNAFSKAILPEGSLDKEVVVGLADVAQVSRLSLLYQPLDGERAIVSILAEPSAFDPQSGVAGNAPRMIASYEWSIKRAGDVRLETLAFTKAVEARRVGASPTTSMNWGRIGRNIEIIHLPTSPQTMKRVKATELVLTPAKTTGWTFWRPEISAAVWPRPSLYVKPSPLNVHRHLGLILTRNAQGLGRNLEAFGGAWLLTGETIPLPKDIENGSVRIVEMELPAQPLSGAAAMNDYKTVCFDLEAVRKEVYFGSGSRAEGLFFCVRFLGDGRKIAPGWSLRLGLQYGGATIDLDVTCKTLAKPIEATNLLFALPLNKPPTTELPVRIVDAAGKFYRGEIAQKVDLGRTGDSETVSLTFQSGTKLPNEWWADVSMLVLPSWEAPKDKPTDLPKPIDLENMRFSFDWFFTGEGEAGSEAVRAASLENMTEAEARIIAVSPPIAVVANPT